MDAFKHTTMMRDNERSKSHFQVHFLNNETPSASIVPFKYMKKKNLLTNIYSLVLFTCCAWCGFQLCMAFGYIVIPKWENFSLFFSFFLTREKVLCCLYSFEQLPQQETRLYDKKHCDAITSMAATIYAKQTGQNVKSFE